jgi:hypothetical protein
MEKKMVLTARIPSDDEIERMKFGRQLHHESPKIIDEQAKALVALSSALITLYTTAIALFKISDRIIELSTAQRVLLALPIILWLISIGSNLWISFPKSYEVYPNSPNKTVDTLNKIIDFKLKRLKVGALTFFLAFCVLIASLFVVSIQIPPIEEAQNVQFIVPEDNEWTFEAMQIELVNGTHLTKPIELIPSTEDTIGISLSDGRKIEFNRSLISAIIYPQKNDTI